MEKNNKIVKCSPLTYQITAMVKFYHTSLTEITTIENRIIFVSKDIVEIDAEYIQSQERFIYEVELNEDEFEIEDDFAAFDCGYLNKDC